MESTDLVDLLFTIIVQRVTVQHLVPAKLQKYLVLEYLGQVRRQIIIQV